MDNPKLHRAIHAWVEPIDDEGISSDIQAWLDLSSKIGFQFDTIICHPDDVERMRRCAPDGMHISTEPPNDWLPGKIALRCHQTQDDEQPS